MNLIDILNRILNTKGELKEILSESEDISRYSVSIHNYLATRYNNGFRDGWHDAFYSIAVYDYSYTEDQIPLEDYTGISTGYYSSDSENVLTDIMRDVLSYRQSMRDELNTDDEYFEHYPALLQSVGNELYSQGYSDGNETAEETITIEERPSPAVIQYSNNTFSLSTSTEGASIYYKISETGISTLYTAPVAINEDCTLYYWSAIGRVTSYDPVNEDIPSIELEYDSSSTGEVPPTETPILPPLFVQGTDNKIYMTCPTTGVNIRYSIDEGETWNVFRNPIQILQSHTVQSPLHVIAVSYTASQISSTSSDYFHYIEEITQTSPSVIASLDTDNNDIILITDPNSIDGESVSIYYSTDSYSPDSEREYTLYTEPIHIDSHTLIWAYSSCANCSDSEIGVWIFDPVVQVTKPDPPIIRESREIGVIISAVHASSISYRIGDIGDFVTVEDNYMTLYLNDNITGDVTIYAYCSLNGVDSDIVSYNYTYYSDYYVLTPPTFNLVNNRIVIISDYNVRYTIDGSNPREGGTGYNRIENGFEGIPITETTYIRAYAYRYIENGYYEYSAEVSATFTPTEIGSDESLQALEYFNIIGASEIYVSLFNNNTPKLRYSTNKRDWTTFTNTVTGLNPETRYYISATGTSTTPRKLFTSMSFGANDRVTVSGNIVSTLQIGDFTSTTTTTLDRILANYFQNCTSIVDASNLYIPFTTLVERDFESMFEGCTNLVSGVNIRVKDLKDKSCYRMYRGCTSLIDGGRFEFNSLSASSCEEMYYGCTSLTRVGNFDITGTVTGNYSMKNTFNGDISLPTVNLRISGDLSNSGWESFCNVCKGCVSLDSRDWISNSAYIDTIKITSTTLGARRTFTSSFEGCTSLSTFGSLPAPTATPECYSSMFSGCSSLRSIDGIGLTTLESNCCNSMFKNCVSLQTAPVLLAHTLTIDCYNEMFRGCSRLNYIKALFLNSPSFSTNNYWVEGVNDTGTFEMDEDATWYVLGVHGIPEGWVLSQIENQPGVIESVSLNYNSVSISSSNGNDIYYQLNRTEEDGWILYTGSFDIDTPCIIYAKCVNSRGMSGTVYESELLIPSLPDIVLSHYDNVITLTATDPNYHFQNIYYSLRDTGSAYIIQDFTPYTRPFTILGTCKVLWYGESENGTITDTKEEWIALEVSAPSIVCSDNLVTISTTTDNVTEIDYNFDGGSSWTEYVNPFLISNDCDIYTMIRIENAYTHSTDTFTFEPVHVVYSETGNNYVILTPTFVRHQPDENVLLLQWPSGVEGGVKGNVEYSFDGVNWIEYTGLMISFDSDITIYSRAEYEGNYSPVWSQSFEYVSTQVEIPSPPTINVYYDGYGVVLSITTNETDYTSISGRMIDVVPSSYNQPEWGSMQNGVYISSSIQSGTIQAVVNRGPYSSQIATYYYTRSSVVPVTPPLSPSISYSANRIRITTSETGVSIYYSFNNRDYQIYTEPIDITASKTVYSYVLRNSDGMKSDTVFRDCTYVPSTVVVAPTISYSNNVITITKDNVNDVVWYSIDGGSNIKYTEPITITRTVNVNAFSRRNGRDSEIVSRYCAYVPTPTVVAPTISYSNNVITITKDNENDTVHYSFDGSTYNIYSTPISISNSVTVYAYSTRNGAIDSEIVSRYCQYIDTDYTTIPLTFAFTSIIYGDTAYVQWSTAQAGGGTILYKKNNGEINTLQPGGRVYLNVGETVSFYGAYSTYNYAEKRFKTGTEGTYHDWADNVHFDIYGNINSLINKDNFNTITTLTEIRQFGSLFSQDDNIYNANNLVLPATTLTERCYDSMFQDCENLLTAPTILPATTLTKLCYREMFWGCHKLLSAPELPATTLAISCYFGMFEFCDNLLSAPELPATTLADSCYNMMFYSCDRLNYVKCLATTPTANLSTSSWLYGVSSVGTFIKPSSATFWSIGIDSGIPSGWNIINI